MSPASRERVPADWAESPIGLRRSAFHGLRKLLTFLAYADPGEETVNPRLAAIGYEPDDPPVTAGSDADPADPPAVRGRADPTSRCSWRPMRSSSGSGAGGGVIAAALAAAGRSRGRPRGRPVRRRGDDAARRARRLRPASTSTTASSSTWDGAVTMLAGSAVGGGTLVNWMTSLPAPDVGPRGVGARPRPRGHDRRGVGRRRRGHRGARSGSRRRRGHPAQGRCDPARRRRAWLGGRTHASQRDRLRRLRELSVRLPAGHEAVGHPGASRRRRMLPVRGSCQGSARRAC